MNTIFKAISLSIVMILAVPGMVIAEGHDSGKITVTGIGTATARPDMAVLSFGIVKEAETARVALDENNNAMNGMFEVVKAAGVEEKDIQTSQFSIQPRYIYPKQSSNAEQPAPRIVGYTVTNTITIRVRNIAETGTILDQVVSAGVNSGGSIQFKNSDPASNIRSAREKAVKDAKEKAVTLAASAGVRLGKVLMITEPVGRTDGAGIARARMSAAAEAAQVPVATGEQEFRVTVNMTWELVQ